MEANARRLSVVVPVYNESACLCAFHSRLVGTLESRVRDETEILYVNDGSTDQTAGKLQQLCRDDARVRILELSRNFGHQAALLAGLSRAAGDRIVMMDGDMQHPPELVPDMMEKANQGYDIVESRRVDSDDFGWIKRLTSRLFYWVFRHLSGLHLQPGMADFRLVTAQVRNELLNLQEAELFLRGAFVWMGFRKVCLTYRAEARGGGTSKYTMRKMMALALSGLTAYSALPLRLSLLLAAMSFACGSLYVVYACYAKFVAGNTVAGWTSLVMFNFFLFSCLFLLIGVMGEYIARIYQESKKRPPFIIRQEYGCGLARSASE